MLLQNLNQLVGSVLSANSESRAPVLFGDEAVVGPMVLAISGATAPAINRNARKGPLRTISVLIMGTFQSLGVEDLQSRRPLCLFHNNNRAQPIDRFSPY